MKRMLRRVLNSFVLLADLASVLHMLRLLHLRAVQESGLATTVDVVRSVFARATPRIDWGTAKNLLNYG
jgi:hypothetical protein